MVKVLVSLDDELVERLDAEARARRLSRSALIAEIATKALDRPQCPGDRPEVRQALRRLDELLRDQPGEDSTAAIRAMRDAR